MGKNYIKSSHRNEPIEYMPLFVAPVLTEQQKANLAGYTLIFIVMTIPYVIWGILDIILTNGLKKESFMVLFFLSPFILVPVLMIFMQREYLIEIPKKTHIIKFMAVFCAPLIFAIIYFTALLPKIQDFSSFTVITTCWIIFSWMLLYNEVLGENTYIINVISWSGIISSMIVGLFMIF